MIFVPSRQGNNNPATCSLLHCDGIHITRLEKQIPGMPKQVNAEGFGEIFQLKKAKKLKLLN